MSTPVSIGLCAFGTALALAACAGANPAGSARPSASPTATSSPRSTSIATGSVAPPPSASPVISSTIVGVWHRTILCDDARKVFAEAGLLESHSDWVCRPGDPPNPHSHFFTADGQFGSHDPGGAQVDDGDFVLVDDQTVSFPSHSREFGFEPILVHFALADGRMTFGVQMPPNCSGACADAWAWALSAFGTNPWEPGELP